MQQNKLMMRMAIYCFVFVATAMGAMLYYSANKIVVVADVAQDDMVQTTEHSGHTTAPEHSGDAAASGYSEVRPARTDKNSLQIDRNSQNTSYLCIPLPENVRAEEVTVENHYMDRELWISIEPKEMEGLGTFYEDNSVYGNSESVLEGHFSVEQKRVCLQFKLTDVYEYHSILEDSTLYVEFMAPKEAYDKIIVIDPAYGLDDTGVSIETISAKDITLQIAKALKTKLDETDIKVYYTRMDDSNPDAENRVRLASATKADLLIRIEVSSAQSSKEYGTEAVYNSRFFIPGFGSIELADLLEREVVTAISGKANGLLEADEDDTVICDATVPAAAIKVGYLTNGQEAILLQREDYIQRIAEGIYQAIIKAYEER